MFVAAFQTKTDATIFGRCSPGGYATLDAMEVGNGGMSTTEQQAIFSLYGLIKTPLYIGADVTTLSGARNAFLAPTIVR